MRYRFARVAFAMICVFVSALSVQPSVTGQQPQPQTWQETQNFRSGPTPFEPLMKFWYELEGDERLGIHPAAHADAARSRVHAGDDRERSGGDTARRDPLSKTIVLIANAVHGSETAGKEASQLVARELVSGSLQPLLDDVIVRFVPLINPDRGEGRRRTNDEAST